MGHADQQYIRAAHFLFLAAIDDALGIGDDGCCDPDQTLTAIAELKALQKMEPPQLRKIHPLDFPIEVFLADLTTRPANIIRAELASFASYAGTGTFDIEPPFTHSTVKPRPIRPVAKQLPAKRPDCAGI